MRNKILIPVAAIMISGAIFFGAAATYAQETSTDPHTTLIQKIVQKFGLKESEVKQIFDEVRTARQTEMQKKYEEQLNQYVKDGKITEAQKALIINKHKELQAQRFSDKTALKNLTPEQRRTQMETKRQELETWANQNGIDPQYIGGPGMKGNGMMKRFHQ